MKPNLRQLFFEHVGQTSDFPMGLEVERAEGVWLLGPNGKKWIDLISGVSVSNVGHNNPAVVEAVCSQARDYLHLMVYGEVIQSPQVRYAARIAELLPPRLQSVYFVNSGSEAVEGALKLAKRYTGRTELVSFKNAYHGSTHGSLSVMGGEEYRNSYRPLLPDVRQLRFNRPEDLEQITARTACVIVEPVQGEGGIVPLPGDYLRGVEALCRKHDILFICDEVQAGLCRTGTFWAFQQHGLTPDAISMAKSLANGLPMGAMLATDEMTKGFEAGSHATTFGGGALASGVAAKCVEIMLRDKLADRAAELGKHVMDRVRAIQDKLPGTVREVRGLGLMIGIELAVDAAAVWRELIARGFICNLSHGVTLRLLPALTIDKADLDAFIDTLEDILRTAK